MVLEINKQYHVVNRFVVDFLATRDAAELLEEWKRVGAGKLKTALQKTVDVPPKRIVSKYLYFCDEERPKVLAENPGMNIKNVTCELGRRWREFQADPDPVRMAEYTRLFEEDKRRYDEAIAAKPQRAKRSRAPSAYVNFCAERRQSQPKISLKELSVEWAVVKADPVRLAGYAPTKE